MKLLDDITRTDCCMSCNVGHCVISGTSYCAHPLKGGLQRIEQQDEKARERLARARKVIGLDPPPLKETRTEEVTQ